MAKPVEFDALSGRWLDANGVMIAVSGSKPTNEEILRAYMAMYKKAVAAGKDGSPDFTDYNAKALVIELGHKMSLNAIRNKIAKARRDWKDELGDGPYDYRYMKIDGKRVMQKTWFPTIKTEQTISQSAEERSKEIRRLQKELFPDA